MGNVVSFLGLFVLMFIAWCISSNRKAIPVRAIVGGLIIQFACAAFILKTSWGVSFFGYLGDLVEMALVYVDSGSSFVFGPKFKDFYFAFKVLPIIIFFSALTSLFYYLGVMQGVVNLFATAMQKAMGTTGAETFAAAINIFVGQTEAALAVKPYIPKMTRSELMAVMVGGFANIAGGVLAAFVAMGVDATHLISASVISAPASLLLAKLLEPPSMKEARVRPKKSAVVESSASNALDAITIGATDGLYLALNVAAMLIVFLGLVAMADAVVFWGSAKIFGAGFTMAEALGVIFRPLAWVIGVPWQDSARVGELLGLKMVTNEFIAYQKFVDWLQPGSGVELTERSRILCTYALCGFANFSSIGIQIGGIATMAPDRRSEISAIAIRAMIGGTLATLMCACVAGVFL